MRWGDRALGRVPHARRIIRVEGLLPTHPDYRDGAEAKRDWGIARALALAGALSGGGVHQERAAAMLQAWFDVYETRFNPIVPRLAQKHGVLFYPFFLENVAGNRELNQADGMHPNAQGVQKIVKGILPSVKALAEQLR